MNVQKPAIKAITGGWRNASLLLVNQFLVALAFSGVEANLVLFAKLVLRKSNAESANIFTTWIGTTNFFSLIGAFLSDSYLGRYLTCIIFQLVFIIGLLGLSLSTHDCEQKGVQCESDAQNHLPAFYLSLYLIALGSGVFDPALPTLAADQFDEDEPDEQRSKNTIYGYLYASSNLGSWICTCCAGVSFLVLMSGRLRYKHHKTFGNPISKFTQVIVAFFRNMFFNRVAMVSDDATEMSLGQGQKLYTWKYICSVKETEGMKYILRVLPIWFCTIFTSSVKSKCKCNLYLLNKVQQ
ncbi:unnamed protein product [Vicia faba]|uniref:Uncharacterized protein n=1 Tax=Vicia faba TaxID=3906 RepID=A0AAV0ZV14_VICFA|nr:unnamed protein product [Vicia faba]